MEHEEIKDRVLYICDGEACESCNSWMKECCRHTTDIRHAAHFKKFSDVYMEEDIIVSELCQTNRRKKLERRRLARPRGAGKNV